MERLGVQAAGPALVRKIQSDGFHDLAVEERRQLLATVCNLRPARGEAVAIELLSKRRLLANEAVETSRTLAAEALAAFDSEETRNALQVVAKQRWGSSSNVRDAAAKALATIESRKARKPSVAVAGKT